MIVLSSVSCRTTQRAIDTTIEAKSASRMETVQAATGTATEISKDSSVMEIWTETVETLFSSPDSAGRQYVQKQTTSRKIDRRQLDVTHEKWNNTIWHGKTFYGDSATTNVKQTATEETAIHTPSWVVWGIIALVAAGLIIVILFLKKYRIL